MNAVLGVDNEFFFVALLHDFIDRRRAITLRGFGIKRQIGLDRNLRIAQLQMAWLALFMHGVRQSHRGQTIKCQNAVRLRIDNFFRLVGTFQLLVIGVVFQRVGQHPSAQRLECRMKETKPHPPVKSGTDVPHLIQFFPEPAFLQLSRI